MTQNYDTDQLIRDYYENKLSLKLLGKAYNSCDVTIIKQLKALHVVKRFPKKIHYMDKTKFSQIKTEDDAYWLGFLYADGNVHSNAFSIKLGLQDLEHLKEFKEYLNCSNVVETTTKYARIRLHSPEICANLKNLGIFPNKSNKIMFPDMANHLYPHFIRGFHTGDGWTNDKMIGFTSCSKKFVEEIQKHIQIHCQRTIGSLFVIEKSKQNPKWSDAYTLAFGGRKALRQVSDYLWTNATLYLKRKKFNLFNEL